jgi:hypothetical protein
MAATAPVGGRSARLALRVTPIFARAEPDVVDWEGRIEGAG